MNPFVWIKSVMTAGRRLAASLNALAETVDEVNQSARRATGLKDPAALPAPRKERIAVAANKKE